jgi:hypothetical protein
VGQCVMCRCSPTVRATEANLQRDETGHSHNARIEVEAETTWALMETEYWTRFDSCLVDDYPIRCSLGIVLWP